ncbi:MAG: NAD(P)-binding domain-containing protein [Gammaproteobacteria bacterium]|nr:NAD(P)-binding domain-containing protein [Gammaproteobacteria bacterium]
MPRTQSQQHIAVVGAGLMGHAIAYTLASTGHTVSIFDRTAAALDSLPERLSAAAETLGHDAQYKDAIQICAQLRDAASEANLVIEAATEDLDIKQFIVAELEAIVSPDTIIASNTSALPITEIATKALHQDRILGTHFWNPPHLVKLVEVVQAKNTAPEVVQQTMQLLGDAGYEAVHVKKDIPGFIGNRLQHALKREAIALVADGVCDAETVDKVVKSGFGNRLSVLGPLEQSDLVGLNLTKAIHDTLMPDIDRTDSTHPYLEKLITEGKLGMSSGEGFYKWTPAKAEAVRARLRDFLKAQSTPDS